MHKNNVAWAADLVSCNCLFRCICTARGIRNREEEFEIERKIVPIFNTTIILLHIIFFFLRKKNKLIFLDKEDFDFLFEGQECEILLFHENENLWRA